MPAYPLRALVLKTTRLGETDMILTLLAQDGSQVRAVAKGMRKPTSRFASRLQPFTVVDLLMHTGRSLQIVSEVETAVSNVALREDYDLSTAAAVVVDLLDKVSLEGQSEDRLFELGCVTLASLCSCDGPASRRVVVAFLIKALAMHGYRPHLRTCMECGSAHAGIVGFSLGSGGVLCQACRASDPSALSITHDVAETLQRLMMSTMDEVVRAEVSTVLLEDCLDVVSSFASFHLPARLKALELFRREGHR